MQGIIDGITNVGQAISDIASSIWSGMVYFFDLFCSIGVFLWGIIQLVGKLFSFIFGSLRTLINHLLSLSFWADLTLTFRDLTYFLGISNAWFIFMFYFVFVLTIFYFLLRLLTLKVSFREKSKK